MFDPTDPSHDSEGHSPEASRHDLRSTEQALASLDGALRQLLEQRVALCQQWAAAYQAAHPQAAAADIWSGLPHPAGQSAGQSAGTSLPAGMLRAIDREVHSGCAAAIRPLRVVYLGPEYSYSHLAALERFGQGVTLLPVATIASVFDEMARGQADFGIVPLENSTDGRIADTLDVFARTPSRICGEIQLRIHHCLWGSGHLSQVRQVHSKPQALSQCRGWLSLHLPDAECIASASTTAAAQRALQQVDVAAVASRAAGQALGLNLLAENIEDRADNVTRFAVIGPRLNARTGHDKTTLMFELPHRPGALADAMAVFKKNGLNLTWIESFPKPGSPQEYVFFVELVGHEADPRVRGALHNLAKKAVRMTVLGSYPAALPH